MISVFLAWLRLMEVARPRCKFRLQIHESADVQRAKEYWADLVDVDPSTIGATLKRHNPKTVRYNTGETYHGCLIVDVAMPRELYQSVEALWRGIARSVASDRTAEAD
jgi:hypothetical protein